MLAFAAYVPASYAAPEKLLAEFEATRDVWQEALDGVREIKAGGGKRTKVEAKSNVVRA